MKKILHQVTPGGAGAWPPTLVSFNIIFRPHVNFFAIMLYAHVSQLCVTHIGVPKTHPVALRWFQILTMQTSQGGGAFLGGSFALIPNLNYANSDKSALCCQRALRWFQILTMQTVVPTVERWVKALRWFQILTMQTSLQHCKWYHQLCVDSKS